jgi:hypothetical protein
VHARIGADVGAIVYHYVSGECGCVCHDDAVAEQAIVSNVCLGHYQAIVTDFGEHASPGSAAMNGHELADLVSLADPRF